MQARERERGEEREGERERERERERDILMNTDRSFEHIVSVAASASMLHAQDSSRLYLQHEMAKVLLNTDGSVCTHINHL